MITFSLNGDPVSFKGDPNTPLLWVIRDDFKLKGSKFGCGAGLCGACTMHLDGTAIKTCVLPVVAAANKRVTTIEGLGSAEALHPLQAAWVKHNVPQCGYCQSGQIMAAAALIADKPDASSDDIDQAMSGNICRCGCYPRIKAAIVSVADSSQSYDATVVEANS
ncbi:MAG: (2Fe-2S)-binding protein [Luminiphilus sp.]|nr:(2Fe-2S)-binding protein [Luminiphilus sp.]MDG1460930.1 (2Fe-2S)-binding protein [Luminiphilus sp.]